MTPPTSTPPAPLQLGSPALLDDPYPVYRWFREHDPLHRQDPVRPDGDIRYFATRYHDVAAGLRDARLSRESRSHLWQRDDELPAAHRAYAATVREWLLFLDPPAHSRARLAVNRLLDDDFIRSCVPQIEAVIAGAVDELAERTEFDAIGEFAALLPIRIARDLLGLSQVPVAEARRLAVSIFENLGSWFSEERMREASGAVEQLTVHFQEAIRRRRRAAAQPGDLLDRILENSGEGRPLEPHQLLPTCLLLLVAAMDNTSNLIGNGLLTLLRHGEQYQRLRESPSLLPNAVDEILRYESPVQQISRHASEPLEFGGRPIEKGAAISFLLGAANRDPAVFLDPDRFDITRTFERHAAFGFGVHHCPGALLARLEAEIALRAFAEKFPEPELIEDKPQWRPLVVFRGLQRLRIRRGRRA